MELHIIRSYLRCNYKPWQLTVGTVVHKITWGPWNLRCMEIGVRCSTWSRACKDIMATILNWGRCKWLLWFNCENYWRKVSRLRHPNRRRWGYKRLLSRTGQSKLKAICSGLESSRISSSYEYSVILGFLRDPMRFFVPPHQNFYERYTAEHYYYKHW